MIAPILDEIADEYQGKLTVAKLNIDQNPGTAPKYASAVFRLCCCLKTAKCGNQSRRTV
ncbi:thioredoxin [Salmonella enterica subsp. enterica serovar Typhimurium]|nr:thioredoxin [Salmonella enterica subsp. enterica serovar Typhimurium]